MGNKINKTQKNYKIILIFFIKKRKSIYLTLNTNKKKKRKNNKLKNVYLLSLDLV